MQYALNNSGDATLRKVSSDLSKLHAKRRVADYEPKNVHPEQLANAQDAVRLAADVIAWLDDVRDNATPERTGAIAAAISNWMKGAQTAALRQKSGTG